MHELFDDLGQLSVHLFNRLQVGQPAYHPRCDHQRLPNPKYGHQPYLT